MGEDVSHLGIQEMYAIYWMGNLEIIISESLV
jgi:hypothetical protein